ncbi:MAG: hypothetical protein ACD_10C00143G0003 [uncultured bacterium]|nr:MAG: hypothetical protein ACD_10C00143G0003 [uncultured bacterium]
MPMPRASGPSSWMSCSVPTGERVMNIGFCPAFFIALTKAVVGL